MATTEDLRFYDGTSWQSLSALAAKQVAAKLPIESVDGKVVLSDSSGSFVVSTGGEERLTVDQNGRLLLTSASKYIGLQDLKNYLQFSNSAYGDDSLLVRCAGKSVFVVDGTNENVSILNNYDLVVTGGVLTPSISGTSSNDASVALGSTVTIDADQYTPLNLTNDKDGLLIRTINKDGRQYWHGQDSTGWCISTRQVVNGTAQSVRSFGAVGDYETPDWRVYAGGFIADEGIKSPSISGVNSTDASVTLGVQATLTAGDGSEYVVTDAASIATKKYTDSADQALQSDINQKAEIWTGTQAEYDALGIYSNYTLYCITD